MDNYLHLMGIVHERQAERRREAAMVAWSLRVAKDSHTQAAHQRGKWSLSLLMRRWGWLVGKPQRVTRSVSLSGYALQMRAGR